MQVLRKVVALVATVLSLQLGTVPASAHTPPTPEDLPPGAWYGEQSWSSQSEIAVDDLTTLPGARLLLKVSADYRPGGTQVPHWYWMNTRAGSRFYLSACPGGWTNPDDAEGIGSTKSGIGPAIRVPRKQFMAAVRAGHERAVYVRYNAHRNFGIFEAALDDRGQGPKLPACPPDAPATAPPQPEFLEPDLNGQVVWREGGSQRVITEQLEDQDTATPLQIRALPREGLVVSYHNWGMPRHRWYGTRALSRFYLPSCDDPWRDVPVAVTRDQFVQAVAGVRFYEIIIWYDADKDVGRFQVISGPCQERAAS